MRSNSARVTAWYSASLSPLAVGSALMLDRILKMSAPSVPRARGARCGAIVLALLAVVLLGACGQKGPLTLPAAPAPASAATR
ncbi:MAG: lipoprotein [Rubrivivax sp.]